MHMSNEKILAGILLESDIFLRSMRYILTLVANPFIKNDFSEILNELKIQTGTCEFVVQGRIFSNLEINYANLDEINNTLPDFKKLEEENHINEILHNRENLETFLKIFNQEDLTRTDKIKNMEKMLFNIISEKVFLDGIALTDSFMRDEWCNFWKQPFKNQIDVWKSERKSLRKIQVHYDERTMSEQALKEQQKKDLEEEDHYIFELISNDSAYQQVLKALCFHISSIIASVNDYRYIFNQDLYFTSLISVKEKDYIPTLFEHGQTVGIVKFLKKNEINFALYSLKRYAFRTLKLEESPQYLLDEERRHKPHGKATPTFFHINNFLHFYNENYVCLWSKELNWHTKKSVRLIKKNTLHLSFDELKAIHSIEPQFIPEYVIHDLNPDWNKLLETVRFEDGFLKISRMENAHIYNILKSCGLLCAPLPTIKELKEFPCSTFIWTPEKILFYYNKWEDFLRPVAMKAEKIQEVETRLAKGNLPDALNKLCILCPQDSDHFYQYLACDPEKMPEIQMPVKDKSKNLPRLHLPLRHHYTSDSAYKSDIKKTPSPKEHAALKPASPLPKAMVNEGKTTVSTTTSPREKHSPLRKNPASSRESETESSRSEKKVTIPEVKISPRSEDIISRESRRRQVTHSRSPSPSPSSSDKKMHRYQLFKESDEKKSSTARRKQDSLTPSTSVEKSSPQNSPHSKESPHSEVKILPDDGLRKSNTAPSISPRRKNAIVVPMRKRQSLHMSDSDQMSENEKKSPDRETAALPVPEPRSRQSLSPGRQNRLFKTEDNVTVKRSDKKPLLDVTDEPTVSRSPKQDYS